jgi:hypothetical protein
MPMAILFVPAIPGPFPGRVAMSVRTVVSSVVVVIMTRLAGFVMIRLVASLLALCELLLEIFQAHIAKQFAVCVHVIWALSHGSSSTFIFVT